MNSISRTIIIISCLLVAAIAARGAAPLTSCAHSDEVAYKSVAKGQKLNMMGDYSATSGFSLGQSGGYLIAPKKIGKVTFSLGGRYDKLTFMMGPMMNNQVGSTPSIVTVRVDGRKVVDEKLYEFDIPRPFEVDVAGAGQVTFDILSGEIYLGVGDPKLWTAGEKAQKPAFNQTPATAKTMLVSQLRPYYFNSNVMLISPSDKYKTLKINGKPYHNGLVMNMAMQISGGDYGGVMFNLNKRYDKLSFIIGPLDNDKNTAEGHGYITIQGDGYTIYQKEVKQLDTAEQVEIDVSGVSRLSFHSEQSKWDINAAFADITAWPKGMSVANAGGVAQTPAADPALAKLPDVCPLMSNIEPFAILGGLSRDEMLYTGKSDYIGFSMGGVKHSEGMLFASGANFFHDHIYSSASFNVGRQFDYITFVVGPVGKTNIKDGEINVLADDRILYTVPVRATEMPTKHWVKIDKCSKLTFDNRKGGGTVGVADIVLYRGEIVENDLFVHPKPDCPDNIDLLRLCKPYLHFVSGTEPVCADGSDIKQFWTLRDGTRINNGFVMKTSVHFSLEHGVLGDDPNAAMAGAVGATAVGSSFVAGGMVGGVAVGSTLAGMAGLMMLAAGGEAEDSSVAAFNTYGEYNSVTFTVACVSPSDAGLLDEGSFSDRQQRILIGADGEVMAELMVNEMDGPTTFTVPINGCQQLIFWMPCDRGSGKYIVYDAKLSKTRSELIRPASSIKSHAEVRVFDWTDVDAPGQWERPKYTNVSEVDQYFGNVLQLLNGARTMIHNNGDMPQYEFHTTYLRTAAGQVCKATQIVNNGGPHAEHNATGVQAALGANFVAFEVRVPELATEIAREIKKLSELNSLVTSLRIQQASVALSLPQLGLLAIRYGKELGKSKKVVDQCNKVTDTYLKSKQGHYAAIKWLLDNAVDIDGKQSTVYTIFTPLAPGETPPPGADLQLVETFKVK